MSKADKNEPAPKLSHVRNDSDTDIVNIIDENDNKN